MLKLSTGVCIFFLISSTLSSIIDVFEATNGHEPRVAIKCGKVPFYIDLETGAWVADSEGVAKCDKSKEEVKSYCQKTYPNLNITNIVEANKPVKFNNWCEPGKDQCDEAKKVVPYRCLVNEYEADALMVPDGCKFDHVHDQDMCMTHNQWRKKAAGECKRKYSMKLRDYGILLSCKTDFFTGVEYVCCPKKSKKHPKKHNNLHKKTHYKGFSAAIKNFQKYLPLETKGCDRSTYITKQTEMEDRHRTQIAAVVDEWDEAEKRYNKLKVKDPVSAEEKMKRTLEVFRQTLAALEKESKDEKSRLRAEHADCINTQIAKNKRDAMVAYLGAIEEEPVNAEKILKAVKKFIQVCEHDRVHSLRHFEHVRNRDAEKAGTLRGELLQHLKDLNKVVNESMALLNYLPEIAQQFGISGKIGGAILKPRLEMPEDDHSMHDHEHVKRILDSAHKKYGTMKLPEIIDLGSVSPSKPTAPVEPKPVSEILPKTREYGNDELDHDDDLDEIKEREDETRLRFLGKKERAEEETIRLLGRNEQGEVKVLNGLVKKEESEEKTLRLLGKNARGEAEVLQHLEKEVKDSKSPFAYNAIMGLSCGVLVIMLFVVIAMIMRRRRMVRTRVVIAENNDEREHLVEMQKNGFENPTYKFFYY